MALGPWIAYEVLGLLLEGTGRRDGYRRVGRFKADDDLAKKYFRRSTYPLELENSQHIEVMPLNAATAARTAGTVDDTERRGWFGRWKTVDEANDWIELVILLYETGILEKLA